jgi:hypothetical protein
MKLKAVLSGTEAGRLGRTCGRSCTASKGSTIHPQWQQRARQAADVAAQLQLWQAEQVRNAGCNGRSKQLPYGGSISSKHTIDQASKSMHSSGGLQPSLIHAASCSRCVPPMRVAYRQVVHKQQRPGAARLPAAGQLRRAQRSCARSSQQCAWQDATYRHAGPTKAGAYRLPSGPAESSAGAPRHSAQVCACQRCSFLHASCCIPALNNCAL